MPVLAIGIDLVDVARIDAMLSRHGERFLGRVFTPGEVAHSQGRRSRAQHLAARFAAKEAAMKALGTGLAHGLTWHDVEVVALPTGQPRLVLHRAALERARAMGASPPDGWHLSLSHTRGQAVAMVVVTASSTN